MSKIRRSSATSRAAALLAAALGALILSLPAISPAGDAFAQSRKAGKARSAEPAKRVDIPANEVDPAVWGKAWPSEYELWKKTEEPTPTGKSVYKKGFDADQGTYDKLAEYPYMALLFNGWGFGVEYNEPR